MTKTHKIRPYARILTMLGEQLIKNERIALIELIKNAYDADASWVKISFCNFGDGYAVKADSKIIIEDSGHGMTEEIIEKHWLNPATPEKLLRKKKRDTTESGRVIQGEKGIGRFAILKLGRTFSVVTRASGEETESVLEYDFSNYDDDFLFEGKQHKEIFLDDLRVSLTNRSPQIILGRKMLLGTKKIMRPKCGTRIEICNLKGSWSRAKVEKVYQDVSRLESIFEKMQGISNSNSRHFDVLFYKDQEHERFQDDYLEKLGRLLSDRPVLKIENGRFDDESNSFSFVLNGKIQTLKLSNPRLTGLNVFRVKYGDAGKKLLERSLECGPFEFAFYVFDFSKKAPIRYKLDPQDKSIIRAHRIYLYRDGIRVYPYGEVEDDWLQIDMYRGTIGAGHFLSNDQVVGYVSITQKDNPRLRDKTNREGLIEEGNATDDFITLIQSFLTYIRKGPYARYRLNLESKKSHDIFTTELVQHEFNRLEEAVSGNKKAEVIVKRAAKEYQIERQYLLKRAETTEELAGVGLSVETASHDIMAFMDKAFTNIDGLIKDSMSSDEIDKDILLKEMQAIRGALSFVQAQLKDMQLLFKSSKQRRKVIRVKDLIEKVERIYKRLFEKESIELTINTEGSPLIAKTTDAVLLQLFLNLFDNAIYWLRQVSRKDKHITIVLDGNKGQMIFADNGPGVSKEDMPYIFEPFYSGKGEEGRGLGLYIARQLLERNEYSIDLAELKSERVLSGANFVVNFVSEAE